MAALLVISLCVPQVFEDLGLVFAGAYAVVRAAHIALFRLASVDDADLRASTNGLAVSTLARLVSNQTKDGGLAWISNRTPSLRATCQAVLFLALAKQRGFAAAAAPLDQAAEWLLGGMRQASAENRARIRSIFP